MLQLQVIRQNADRVKERLAVRNFKELNLVDTVLSLDEERKKLQLEFDNTQSKVNSVSREIGQLMGKGNKPEADTKKLEVANKNPTANAGLFFINAEKFLRMIN